MAIRLARMSCGWSTKHQVIFITIYPRRIQNTRIRNYNINYIKIRCKTYLQLPPPPRVRKLKAHRVKEQKKHQKRTDDDRFGQNMRTIPNSMPLELWPILAKLLKRKPAVRSALLKSVNAQTSGHCIRRAKKGLLHHMPYLCAEIYIAIRPVST